MHDEFSWGTWTAERPAELTHLESGVRLTPVLYSDRAERATDLPPGKLLRYGYRGVRDGRIEFTSCFEDTELDWCCDRRTDGMDFSWTCRSNGEWGLRYWVCLCLSGPGGTSFTYDPGTGVISAKSGTHSMNLRCAKLPLLTTVHDDVCGLIDEFESKGYFYLNSRDTHGSFLALRFNLDEAPEMSIKVDMRSAQVNKPASVEAPTRRSETESRPQNALQAVHDVLAWNHVFDPLNNRPYTALTRNWSQKKFGGFGVWLNDNLFHALMWTMLDPEKARQNIEAVFAGQTDAGNFPCLVTGNDAWLDRSQLPMASYVLWSLYRATNDESVLNWAYPKLLANHRWWWEKRLLGDTGLVAYGTSHDVGGGLYKGTKLAAKNESSMDNMAVHDEADFDPASGLLQSADVGLNSLLALDGEILALMARKLGYSGDEKELSDRTGRHKARIGNWLWDHSRSVFANRLRDGQFVEALAPTTFFPLVAGIASEDQVKSLVELYLEPEAKFGGTYSLPSAPRDHPAFHDNTYWRGRVWGPLNYWVYQGLMRCRRTREAAELACKSLDMFDAHWRERNCGENYSAVTGEINDQPDTDSFYTWGALLPTLSVLQIISDTPWGGLTINLGRYEYEGAFAPVRCHLGTLEIAPGQDAWEVRKDGRRWLRGSGTVGLSKVELRDGEFTAEISTEEGAAKLAFPDHSLVHADLDGRPLATEDNGLVLSGKLNGAVLSVTLGSKPIDA